tara:strand:+ start:115 stop:2655 length:2541 start_codon:yes stop_codon:yes gene_type:complete
MKLRNTAIALGVGAATAAGLSLLKVNKEVVIGSTAAVTGAVLLYKESRKPKQDEPVSGDDQDFIAYWDLNEFKQLLEEGKAIGSKYFFLIKSVGVCFYVRETDFKKLRKRDRKEFSIHAEGLNDRKMLDLDSDESDKEFEHLRAVSDKFYEGDVCEWFNLSDELLDQVSKKIIEGYSKLKMIVKPLELDDRQLTENEIEDLKDKVFSHNEEILSGGSCPTSPFKADIRFQFINKSNCIDLNKNYDGKSLFIDSIQANTIIKDKNDIAWELHFDALQKGEEEEDNDNLKEAIVYYSKAIDILKTNPTPLFKRARIYRQLGEYENSIEDYNQYILLEPDDFKGYINRGIVKSEKQDYSDAINDLQKGLEINPDDNIGHMHLGFIKQQIKDYKGSIESFTEAIRIDPENRFYYLQRASVSVDLDDYITAEKNYSKAIELGDKSAETYYWRGVARKKIEDFDAAEKDFIQTIELDPNNEIDYNEIAYYSLGLIKESQGLDYQAIEFFEKVLEINPKSYDACIGIANNSLSINEIDYAIDLYNKAIQIDGKKAIAYSGRGNAKSQLDDFEGAISDYSKAIEIDPSLLVPYFNRGNLKSDIDDNEGAISDYSKAIEIDSNHENSYFNRALCKDKLEDNDGYIEDLNIVIELNPLNERALCLRGSYKHDNTDDWDEAVEDLKKAIEIDPEFAQAYFNLGDLLYDYADSRDDEKEGLEEAIQCFTKAIDIDPADHYIEAAYRYRGWANNRINNFKEAIYNCTKLIELDIEDIEAYNDRSIAKLSLKDFDGAINDATKIIEICEDESDEYVDEAYELRGQAKRELGDLKGACEDWKKAAELGREDAVKLLEEHCK